MRVTESVKQEIRAALVREGARLFGEQGFAGTTVDQVTTAAGVAKGTFYNYFSNKEELAMAVVLTLQADAADMMFGVAEGPEPISERLTKLILAPLGWITGNPDLTMVWCVERVRRGRVHGPSTFSQGITAALAEGQKRGEIRTDRQPAVMAAELEGIFLVYILMWYHSGRAHEIAGGLREAVLGYLQGAALTR